MNLGDLPATLFSPAKTAYIGFVVLAALERIEVTLPMFVIVTVLFILVEVGHNDYLRIRLNAKAKEKSARSRPEPPQ